MSDGDKAALVTGGAQRIGRAIALDLAADGFAIAVHYRRSKGEAEKLAGEIASRGGKAAAIACDLSREAEVQTLLPRAAQGLGQPLTVLVNNASNFEMDKVDTATRDSWDRHIETNLRAPLVLSQAFARQLPAGREGNIINLLDQRVLNLTPYFLSYTVAKSGLWTLTQTMALGLAPRIRVNGIGPGPTLPSPRQTEAQFAAQCAAMPLGRGTTPEEIAGAVRFILGASSMTGQLIALDGGQHLGWAVSRHGPAPDE